MTNNIISGVVLKMLAVLEEVLRKLNIDFYLVGALARDIGLSANSRFAPQRKTNDVDVAILLANDKQFYQVKQALLDTRDFTAHESESIKCFTKMLLSWIFYYSEILKSGKRNKAGETEIVCNRRARL